MSTHIQHRRLDIWNNDPPVRSDLQWKEILDFLLTRLERFLGVKPELINFWYEDNEGFASCSLCSRVSVTFSKALKLEAVGSVCMTVNKKKSVNISADILLFADGKRLGTAKSLEPYDDLVCLSFEPDSHNIGIWKNKGFENDANNEWSNFLSLDQLFE